MGQHSYLKILSFYHKVNIFNHGVKAINYLNDIVVSCTCMEIILIVILLIKE